MNKNVKFGLIIVAILGTLGWLAAGGINQTASYYKEIAELERLQPNEKIDKRLRVGGDVELNSITREGRDVHFVLVQEKDGVKRRLKVIYNGTDPLPDTFKDNAPCQALVDGKLGSDNVFRASKLQAKCASKYEAKPVAPVTRG
ncbi:MAG: cytochrome c-type biosis protein CcmE-like protein [Bryobacterales bacterium]|jgi:cytochrome c-type biogenesis protein CcmE|nr:cytochrome c-type biosis protein CcmE-like protein [Bryobacterales bacterium]